MPKIEERIREIEEEIQNTPYNKPTQHHIGKLKAKLAQLKEVMMKRSSGGKGTGFGVKKTGDGTVVLLGFPSVGKSTLLNQLTDAESRVGAYEFTTLKVIPGVMHYKGIKIQILDIPGIIDGASSGKGMGKKIISIARNADLILILLDVFQPEQLEVIERELYSAGISLDQEPPRVKIRKMARGGVNLASSMELTKIDEKMVRSILNVNGIHNAQVTVHEDIGVNQFIDVVMGNRVYLPSLVALNKVDLVRGEEVDLVRGDEVDLVTEDKIDLAGDEYLRLGKKRKVIPISAEKGINLEKLKVEIFKKLNLIRIYMKPQGKKPDYEEPLIVRRGSTVSDVCDKLHREFKEKFRYAKIWGNSVKFGGQEKGLDHILEDGDVLTIIKGK